MLKQLKNVNERYQILIFTSRTMHSELCTSGECSVSHTMATCVAYWQVALMCRVITCDYFSTANHSPSLHPPTLPNTTVHLSHTSSLCASYLFILFSASIPLPLAQVSTPLLSHRLMIRALLCLSIFFSPVPPPSPVFLPHLSKFHPFNPRTNHYLTNVTPSEKVKRE